jgi:hypothetical protein
MNIVLKTRSDKAETGDLCHDDRVTGNACRIFPNQGSPAPLWLKARSRTIGFRHDDLERTHWKKVWRSMFVN